jgi:hypothetical protein
MSKFCTSQEHHFEGKHQMSTHVAPARSLARSTILKKKRSDGHKLRTSQENHFEEKTPDECSSHEHNFEENTPDEHKLCTSQEHHLEGKNAR